MCMRVCMSEDTSALVAAVGGMLDHAVARGNVDELQDAVQVCLYIHVYICTCVRMCVCVLVFI